MKSLTYFLLKSIPGNFDDCLDFCCRRKMKDPPVVRLDLLEEERGSSESPLRSLICRYHWHFDSKLSTEFLKTYGALSDFDSPLKRKKDLHKAIARLKRDLEVLRELGVSSFEDPGSADSEIIRQWYL